MAETYQNSIAYIYQENAGVAAARNTGVLHSKSDFIFFLDADDYIYPDTLEKYVAVLQLNPEVDIVHGGSRQIFVCKESISYDPPFPLETDPFF